MLLEEQFSFDTTNTLLFQIRELLKEQNTLLKAMNSGNKQEEAPDKDKPVIKPNRREKEAV